jgi:hypothetical protein
MTEFLRLAAADHHQNDPADQANAAQHRRKWNFMFLVSAHLQRAGVNYLFSCGVAESSVGERDNANGNQNDADNAGRFHEARLQRAPALNQIDDQYDNGDNDQKVDQAATNMERETKEPEHD